MKLVMVVERPTQFETPLFRWAARDPDHRLRVLYTDPDAGESVHDPELERRVSWGGDSLAGYDHAIAPRHGHGAWLRDQLADRHDLVVVNGYTRGPYLRATGAARRAGSPLALRLDSVAFDEPTGWRRPLKRVLLRRGLGRAFARFLGVGSMTLEYLRGLGIPEHKLGLLPYPVDHEAFASLASAARDQRTAWRDARGIPATAPVVLALAKLHPRETPWDLLRAWGSVAGEERWLLLAGDGPQHGEVEALAAQQRLPRVRLLGYVPYVELPALYAAADLFVHAPHTERWGVSVGEALACGLPVVASSRVGAGRDLIATGENGLIYPAGEPAALATAIHTALDLDRDRVRAASDRILPNWGPAAAWQAMLAAARSVAEAA